MTTLASGRSSYLIQRRDEMRGITKGILKTAVSIPDDVFEKGEKAAKRLLMSGSEL
jgi:hypothetical protein